MPRGKNAKKGDKGPRGILDEMEDLEEERQRRKKKKTEDEDDDLDLGKVW